MLLQDISAIITRQLDGVLRPVIRYVITLCADQIPIENHFCFANVYNFLAKKDSKVFSETMRTDTSCAIFLHVSVCWLVACLLNVPAKGQSISGTDLHRQLYVLPTLRQKLQIKLSTSPSHSILTPD